MSAVPGRERPRPPHPHPRNGYPFARAWRGLLAGLALASLVPFSSAQDPIVEFAPSNPAPLSQPFQVIVKGVPGDRALIVFSDSRNPTPTPWGTLEVTPQSGMSFFLPPIGQNGETAFSCNAPLCDFSVAQKTYYGQAITFSSINPFVARGISELAIVEFVTGPDCPPCVINAATDPDVWEPTPHSQALYLKGCDERRWSMVDPGTYIEYADGTAWLTGEVRSNSEAGERFAFDVTFTGRESLASNSGVFPPAGNPKLDGIRSSALAENGGPIDTSEWHYYTALTGTLTGLGDMAGTNYGMVRYGPAVQVGYGASLKNEESGLSTWLTLTRTSGTGCSSTMKGDINIVLTPNWPSQVP